MTWGSRFDLAAAAMVIYLVWSLSRQLAEIKELLQKVLGKLSEIHSEKGY